jgi:MFS-type transporter involved in bile tolerance (Atg22 family)
MKNNRLKSAWAILAGLLVIIILSVAFDTILKMMGILPWDHLFVSTGLILFVILYRAVFSLAGCYLTAKLAPKNPMKHSIILGIIGTILSSVGAILGADLGPIWYAWTLAVIAIPIAWLGGKLYEIKHAASGSEYII